LFSFTPPYPTHISTLSLHDALPIYLDHPFERMLVDTAVAPNARDVSWINPRIKAGERRKVITGIPGKSGIVYTLDRQTGEFLWRSEEHTSELQSRVDLVCRLLLEKK